MAFHGFVIIKIPLYDQPSISVDMHMSGRVIAFPPDNDVPTAAEFPIRLMLPSVIACVNLITSKGALYV
jgi:hypothetical protein